MYFVYDHYYVQYLSTLLCTQLPLQRNRGKNTTQTVNINIVFQRILIQNWRFQPDLRGREVSFKINIRTHTRVKFLRNKTSVPTGTFLPSLLWSHDLYNKREAMNIKTVQLLHCMSSLMFHFQLVSIIRASMWEKVQSDLFSVETIHLKVDSFSCICCDVCLSERFWDRLKRN